MEKIEYRAVIKFLYLKGKTNNEIKAELDSVYSNDAPSITTVKRWTAEFKRGRTSIFDDERSGRPNEVTTEENINKIHDIVLNDRQIKIREIADIVNISTARVHNILHEHLHMKKLSARWVPRLLTIEHKRNREVISTQCLSMFKRNPNEFMRRLVTVDETWIHHYTPETKEQSKQWVEAGTSAPKKAKVVPSAGKVMATVFWDERGIILIDYLLTQKTVNAEYYCSLLDQLNDALKEKRPHLARKKVLFHHDNAPSHSSWKTQHKLNELGYELLAHPPYSPDLAPSDFFLFPKLKVWLGGKRFKSNDEVIAETNAYFEELDKSYFKNGLLGWEKRWNKCIELKGDYVEK